MHNIFINIILWTVTILIKAVMIILITPWLCFRDGDGEKSLGYRQTSM